VGKRPLIAVVRRKEKDSQLFVSLVRGSRSDISRPLRYSHRFGQELSPEPSSDGQPGENGNTSLRGPLAYKQDLLNPSGAQEIQMFDPVAAKWEGVCDERSPEVVLEQIPTHLEVHFEL